MSDQYPNSHSINFDLEMWNIQFHNGATDKIKDGNSEDYITSVDFMVPFKGDEFLIGKECHFKVPIKGNEPELPQLFLNEPFYGVVIGCGKVENISHDIIVHYGKFIKVGVPSQFAYQDLPFKVFTDNRGEYPCYHMYIRFPFRLDMWRDTDPKSVIPIKYEDEEGVMEFVPDKDKIKALSIINKFLRELTTNPQAYPELQDGTLVTPLKHNDVTAFAMSYYPKNEYLINERKIFSSQPMLYRLVFLSSEFAYKNAILEYFLGSEARKDISILLNRLLERQKEINTPEDLLNSIIKVIDEVLRYHIENRNWIEPFWDGKRTINIDNKEYIIPAEPKGEIKVQPTLFVLLYEALYPLGIIVSKETDEGVGSLDFKCTYTINKTREIFNIPIEFKLAHHGEIEKGILRQLPAYCKACKSSYGIYMIMWFKDEKGKFFKLPERRTKLDALDFLNKKAVEVQAKENIMIYTGMIDASIRLSASKLKK